MSTNRGDYGEKLPELRCCAAGHWRFGAWAVIRRERRCPTALVTKPVTKTDMYGLEGLRRSEPPTRCFPAQAGQHRTGETSCGLPITQRSQVQILSPLPGKTPPQRFSEGAFSALMALVCNQICNHRDVGSWRSRFGNSCPHPLASSICAWSSTGGASKP